MHSQFQSLKLSLLHTGFAELDSNWNFDNVISPFSRLYLITHGEAYVYCRNKKIKLLSGNMYLIPSFTYSSYRCDVSHHQYYIGFLETLGQDLSIFDKVDFKYEVKATKMDKIYFDRLLELNSNRALRNNNPDNYDNYASLLAFQKLNEDISIEKILETQGILKVLFSRFIIKKTEHKNTNKIKLNGVLNYISKHLHDNLRVSELASFCNLTTDHFSRSFKASFGLRPNKYLQLLRIERAQALLVTTDNSLETIAETVGFGNASYFSRTFKALCDKTPHQFRKENKLQ